MTDVLIRAERSGDEAAIRQVVGEAFAGHPHSAGNEPDIVDRLRADGDLLLSLVAEKDQRIIGHVAYSPAILSPAHEGWYTLGPIGVVSDERGRGIARALIENGTERLRQRGAAGIVLLGDPELYARFGFMRDTPLSIAGPLAAYFQVLPFGDDIPEAQVSFAPAFQLARIRD